MATKQTQASIEEQLKNGELEVVVPTNKTMVDKAVGMVAFVSLLTLSAYGLRAMLTNLGKVQSIALTVVGVAMLAYVTYKNFIER